MFKCQLRKKFERGIPSLFEINICCNSFKIAINFVLTVCRNLACFDKNPQVYAVGTDKTIKQIKGSNILREIDLHTVTLSSVVLSHNGNMLFTGMIYNFYGTFCIKDAENSEKCN